MKRDMTSERRRIGLRLAELRAQQGMTIRQLSELSGIPHPTISNIEMGKRSVGIDLLATLCDALGVRIELV